MWENAYLSIKNPKSFQGPLRFARATALRYIGNFRPQNLGPPPWPNPGSAPEHLGKHTHGNWNQGQYIAQLSFYEAGFFYSWMCFQNVKFSLSFYRGSSESLCISKFTQKHISTCPSQHPVLWQPIKGQTTILFISGAFLFSLFRS